MTSCNFKAPNGQNSLLYTTLERYSGAETAAKTWNYIQSVEFNEKYPDYPKDINGEPEALWVMQNVKPPVSNRVQYQITAAQILSSEKAKEVFSKGQKNGWTLEKILTELQVPKPQRALLLNLGITDREELLTTMLANYSYTVEIQTAMTNETSRIESDMTVEQFNALPVDEEIVDDGVEWMKVERATKTVGRRTYYIRIVDGERESRVMELVEGGPTQYYAKLNVKGGINYTENEIATPAIVPSITGHGEFSTRNGIGWFRSDDLNNSEALVTEQNIRRVNPNADFGQFATSKTRRILEVQSDLFQKGRDNLDLIDDPDYEIAQLRHSGSWQIRIYNIDNDVEIYGEYETRMEAEKVLLELKAKNPHQAEQNGFLQLLNKDNNWVTFFVKAIIQDSAKKGYQKIHFPVGNTANRIEGQHTLEGFIILKEAELKKINVVLERAETTGRILVNNGYTTLIKRGDKYFEQTEGEAAKPIDSGEAWQYNYEQRKHAKAQIEKEIADANAGKATFMHIFNFYEHTIKNILDKRGFNPTRITDSNGNEWFEVSVDPKNLDKILLSYKGDTNFAGFKGGFKDTGKGTPLGDGKDKAMREIADGVIVELANPTILKQGSLDYVDKRKNKGGSSSETSVLAIAKKFKARIQGKGKTYGVSPLYDVNEDGSPGTGTKSRKVMLARNSEFKGQPLQETTKTAIEQLNKSGALFIVGDMPDVDSQFVDYLLEIGAPFEIYHTGDKPRIDVATTPVAPIAPIAGSDDDKDKQIVKFTEETLLGRSSKQSRLPYADIIAKVKEVYQNASNAPRTTYDLTALNTEQLKRPGISGYSPIELANIFASQPIPANILFSEDFQSLIENSASSQLQNINFKEVPFLTYNEQALLENSEELFVPMRTETGARIGKNFTSGQQVAAVDTIVALVWNFYKKDSNVSLGGLLRVGGSVYTQLQAFRDKFQYNVNLPAHLSAEKALIQAQNIQQVLNSWNDFVKRAIYKLESYGLRVKDRNAKDQISSLTDETKDVIITEEDQGRGLVDWHDSSFELDPKDTASARIKLFLASIREVEVGPEREPVKIKLSFSDKAVRDRILGKDQIQGAKTMSIRPAEQVQKMGLQIGRQYITEIDSSKFRVTVEKALDASDLIDPAIVANATEEGIVPQVGDVLLKLDRWRPSQNVIRGKENFLGFSQLVDFENLFQEILEVTSGLPNTLDSFTNALTNEGKTFRPVLIEVVNQLKNQTPELQKEFVKVMSKQYGEQTILLYTRRRTGYLDMTSINANSGSAINSIIKQWQENQKNAEILVEDEAGNLVINVVKARNLLDKVRTVNERYALGDAPDTFEVLVPLAEEILDMNGIVMSEEAVDYLFDHMEKVTKGTSVAGGVKEQFGFSADGKPTGIFSAIVSQLNGLAEKASEEEQRSYLANNNPLYTESTSMKILAKLAYKFSPKTAAGSHLNSEGKTIYAYSMNSHLSTSFGKLKNDQAYRDKLEGTFLGKHNWLLQRLNNAQDRDNIGLQYVDGLKEAYKRNARGIVRPKMSTREQLLFALGNFQKQGRRDANFISLTHSDKSTTPMLTGIAKVQTGRAGISQKAGDMIYQTVLGEFERIRYWYKEVKLAGRSTVNDAFNKGGGMFYFLPELNYDYMQQSSKQGKITPDEFRTVWISKGVPNIDASVVDLKRIVLKVFEQQWLQQELAKLNGTMAAEQVYSLGLVDYSYLRQNAGFAGLVLLNDGNFLNTDDMSPIDREDAMMQFYNWANKDFLVNYWLVNTAMSALVYGDPALAFKGKSTVDYKAVEETLNEYQKRLAKDIAPGQDLTWEGGPDETYKALTLLDDERIHDYLNSLEKYRGEKINGTDAQELTTVREHLYVLRSGGLIPEKTYQEMIDIINKGLKTKNKYYEFIEPAHKAVVMQIMKPVSVSQNFDEVPGTATIQYVKSSSMPLYPPMTASFEIDELRKVMEGDGSADSHIPRANFVSAKKMGIPTGRGAKVFDEEGRVNIPKDLDTYVQTLSRSGLRIQQEVPYDELKGEILTGSQSNKLFVEGIDDLTFTIDGKEYTGQELKDLKERVRKDMVAVQYQSFLEKTGAEIAGDEIRIHDKKKLLALLQEEAVSRSYPPNDIALLQRTIEAPEADGSTRTELAIPLFFNPSASRFESLLMSLVKKIGQIYLPGKSYIQAASAGFRFKEKRDFESLSGNEKKGIVWLPGYDGTELKTMTKDSPAQILIPFNFTITNSSGEQVPVDVLQYTKEVDGKLVIDSDKVPLELLQHIGFRIPTQKHNSMLPMQVIGFIPSNMGDTIIVPAAITRQMGSDFDVDKLFVYRRPYIHNAATDTFSAVVGKSSKKLVVDDKEITVDKGASLDELAARYFDIYWAVLTHPNMYETVLQPLDKPDLKNEGIRASQNTPIQNYYSILHQLVDYGSQKDAKIMVGISSLFVTFNSLMEGKGLMVGHITETEGTEDNGENWGADSQDANLGFKADGVKFIAEDEDTARHAYQLSAKGVAKYFEKDIEVIVGEDGALQRVFVDPITGKQSKFDENQALYRTRIDSQVTFQSAFLDHAKERIIDKLNINLHTVYAAFGATSIVSDDGQRMNEKHISLLLRQPAIVRLAQELGRGQDSLSGSFNSKLFNDTLEKFVRKYLTNAAFIAAETNSPEMGLAILLNDRVSDFMESAKVYIKDKELDVLSIPTLKKNLSAEDSIEYHLAQAGALVAFARLNEIGREMGHLQRILNQDPRGPGKDMTTVLATIRERSDMVANPVIANAEELLESEQGFIHRTELDTAQQAYREVLPYEGFTPIIEALKELTGRQNFSGDTIRDIVSDYKSYIFSSPSLGLSENPGKDRFRLLYGTKQDPSLATRVWAAQQNTSNYFLKRLRPQQGDTPNTPSYVFYLASRASALDDQENTAAFLELLTSSDPETKKLAEDLVRYAYLTGGISGSFSFIRYIPADFLISLPFAAQLREINNSLAMEIDVESDASFTDQWVRHNPAMMSKVPQGFNEKVGEKLTLPLPSEGLNDSNLRYLLVAKGSYPTYLSHWHPEEAQWYLFRKDDDSANIYRRIDTLGNSYSTEFAYMQDYQRSIFPENRALIAPPKTAVQITEAIPDKEVWDNGGEPWETKTTTILGLKKQKYESSELTAIVKKMSKNTQVGKATRIVLEEIAQILNKSQSNNPITLTIEEKGEPGQVGLITEEGNLKMFTHAFDKDVNVESFSATLVHELTHGLILPYTLMSKTDRAKYPEVLKALNRVEEIMNEVRETIFAQIENEGFSKDDLKKILNNLTSGTGQADARAEYWAEKLYGISNINEFTSHVLESKEFQSYLNINKSKYGQKSFMSELVDLLTRLLRAIGKELGIKITNDSQLGVALERTLELVDAIRASQPAVTRQGDFMKVIANNYFGGKESENDSWLVATEQQANDIVAAIHEEYPFVEATITEDAFDYKISIKFQQFYKFATSKEPEVITNPLDKVYGRVQEQILSIQSSIARNKKSPDVLRQRQLLTELRTLNSDIKATQDLDAIKTLANFQLEWASKVRDQFLNHSKPTTINQIMTAYRLTDVWTNLLGLIYNDVEDADIDYDKDFVEIQSKAQHLLNEFTNRIMKRVFKTISQETVTDKDFMNIKDTDSASAMFLSLDRAKDKITQEVALTIQDTHRGYLETGQKLVNRLSDFEKEMSAVAASKGLSTSEFYELFFQEGANWGLVTKFSPSFYKWRAGLRNKMLEDIVKAQEAQVDEAARSYMVRGAIDRYWRNLDRKAGFVDVREYLDGDGNFADDEKSLNYQQALIEEYGKEFTEEILKEGQEKYIKYLDDRDDIYDMYDAQVENDLMTLDEAEEAKTLWDLENSPVGKLASRAKNSGTRQNMGERYLVMVPHKESKGFNGESFFESKFDRIKADPELTAVYNKIQAYMDEFTGNLPFYLENKVSDSFLPAIQQRLVTNITEAVDYVKGAPAALIDQLTASSYEEFMQSRTSKEIPILYMDNPFEYIQRPADNAGPEAWKAYEDAKKAKTKEYTRNLPRILELFGLMSYHYKYFSDAKDAIDLGEEILKKADRDMQSKLKQVERNGKITTVQASLKNTLGALEYMKDVLIYKRARALEGKTGEIVTKKDPAVKEKLRELKAELIGLDARLANNEISPAEYLSLEEQIKAKMKAFNVKKVYASKAGDMLITWTQLKALSYNPVSAFNNLLFGLISTSVHANGGEDYTWKDFRKAFSIMMNATGRSLGLARITGNDSAMHKTAEKILNIMDRMGIMGELVDSEYGTSNIKKKKGKLRTMVAPYQMLRSGDYFVKALNMVAVLHHDKITVDGVEKSLWSLLDDNGNFTVNDEQWQSENPLKQTKWNKLRNRIIAVNKINMGNQDKSSPILAKKNILWRLLGQFRLSWFSEGIASRFEGEKDDIQLGRTRKGRYRTYGDLGFIQSISVLSKQMLSAVPGVKLDPYAGARLKNGREMSDFDKANMRRNLTEIGWFLMMYGVAQLLGAIVSGDDDEKRKQIHRFLANMAIRSYQDVALYSNPSVFDQILGTPAPALATIRDVGKFFSATGKLMLNDDYTWEQWSLRLTAAGFIPQTTLINRYKTMTEKDLSDLSR